MPESLQCQRETETETEREREKVLASKEGRKEENHAAAVFPKTCMPSGTQGGDSTCEDGNNPDAYAEALQESADAVQGGKHVISTWFEVASG